MAGNVKSQLGAQSLRTASFAGKYSKLANDIPDSFRRAPSPRRAFDYVRDPYIAKQLQALELTEAQRRGESERSGRGSSMVKLHKPFPELRPEHEQTPLREAFNSAWLREQRSARLADLDRQREQQRRMEQAEYAMQSEHDLQQEKIGKIQAQPVPER